MKRGYEIDWEVDVEHETERLVGRGVAPWAAAEQAVRNVGKRRREQAHKRDAEEALKRSNDFIVGLRPVTRDTRDNNVTSEQAGVSN